MYSFSVLKCIRPNCSLVIFIVACVFECVPVGVSLQKNAFAFLLLILIPLTSTVRKLQSTVIASVFPWPGYIMHHCSRRCAFSAKAILKFMITVNYSSQHKNPFAVVDLFPEYTQFYIPRLYVISLILAVTEREIVSLVVKEDIHLLQTMYRARQEED